MKRLTLPLLLLASSTAAFAATPLSGTYSMHTSVAGNETDGSCTFAVKETAITGSCKGPDGKEIPLTGTVDGNKATWKFDIDFNGTTLTLVHTGTVDDAGTVTGTVEVQPFGVSGEFSGTPAAATAAAPAAAPAAEPSAAAAAAALNGSFTVHISVAGNENDQPCTFTQKDNTLTGVCKSMDGKDLPVSGSVDGKKATWKYDMDFNGTTLTLTYTATLDNPAKVAGSIDVQPFNVTGDFTAVPAAAPAAAPATK